MTLWTRLKSAYAAQSTARVNYALIALGAVLAIAWLLHLQDGNSVKRAQLETLKVRAAEFEDPATLQEWEARARRAADISHQWNVGTWSGSTPGVLAAEIQTALQDLSKDTEVTLVQISVDPDPILVDGQSVLRFELFGRARTRNGLAFFVRLAEYEKRLLLAEATFAPSRLQAQIRVSGLAPIEIVEPLELREAEQ